MKCAIILAAAGFVAAQSLNLDGIPECALPCIKDGLASINCADASCACDPEVQSQLAGTVGACITGACSASELAEAVAAQEANCAAAATETGSATASATESASETVTESETATETEETGSTTLVVETTPASNGTAVSTSTPTATEDSSDSEETGDSEDTDTVDESSATRGAVVGLMALAAGILAAL